MVVVDIHSVPTGTVRSGETFEDFYARELQPVTALAYVLSGSRLGAEDLAQEGFLAAYRRWDHIQGFDDPGAWVRRVVANRAVSTFRRRASELRALARLSPPTFQVSDLPVESAAVWAEVRRLPTRQAQVIALRFVERHTIAQTARILGCSENSVKTHLARAKRTLALRFDKDDFR